MSMTSICSREMIVTFLGTSQMLSSVPKTDWKGRDVGRICSSIGTSLTLYCCICTAASVLADAAPAGGLAACVCAVVGVDVVVVVVVVWSVAGAGLAVCAVLNGNIVASVRPATSPRRVV